MNRPGKPASVARRMLNAAIVWLALGAVINVAVAWACAAWVHVFRSGRCVEGWMADEGLPDRHYWLVMRHDAFGASRIHVMPDWSVARRGTNDERELFPDWCNLPERMRQCSIEAGAETPFFDGHVLLPVGLAGDARGYPWASMLCEWDNGNAASRPAAGEALRSGWELPPWPTSQDYIDFKELRALPYRPYWPGFAANTLVYATALWLMFAAPFALRRLRRIRRGLCPACAYPLGASEVCTECGRAVTRIVKKHI